MEFSIMFWGDVPVGEAWRGAYEMLLEVSKHADANGYAAIWLPERHFHPWGGAHPNPSVLAAAVAVVTKNIRIRAGSVVLPLHHPIRVAEEWSIVDNLSNGRVELAIATGWRAEDFVLAPERYATRREDVSTSIATLQRLWRGEPYVGANGRGEPVEVRTYPRPIQEELPLWITSSGATSTIVNAGGAGFNLLTHLLGQDYVTVERKVAQYQAERLRNGNRGAGKVALMLHTFLGTNRAEVKNTVGGAMSSYLLNSVDLVVPPARREEWRTLCQEEKAAMMAIAFDRYFETASLMGTPASCDATVRRAQEIGISEICCLIDFGLPPQIVMDGMKYLTRLKNRFGRLEPEIGREQHFGADMPTVGVRATAPASHLKGDVSDR
jgi:natural product biosynthesis luciferase-like monooxygenase protein